MLFLLSLGRNKVVHTFRKTITLTEYEIAWLEFEFIYFGTAVQYLNS